MKKILLTGCNGFIGKKLCSTLNKKNYNLICLNKNENLFKIEDLVKNVQVIVHLAAITNPFNKDIWKVNINYTKFLVDLANKYNKKFIYLSTYNVIFGKDNYSKTKKISESFVKKLKNYVVLRPNIIYGKDDRYISRLIKVIKRFPIVPIIGNGKNKIQPIYLDDLVKIIEICIKNNKIKGVFTLSGKNIISYNDLVILILKKLKLNKKIIKFSTSLIRPIAFFSQNFSKRPLITTVQLNNMKFDLTSDTKRIEKIFKINLKDINNGINILLKDE